MSETTQQLGKYRILEELGTGGFATVFKAVDTTLDREVALKVLHPPLLADRRFVQNFRQEAKTLAALRHPQIVTIYEVDEVDGRIFIAMDLARGANLARAIAARKRIDWQAMLALLEPICAALDYAHAQRVAHRDLKPANILIDTQRGALLTDFGFARLLAENTASMTMSGGIVGTPGYIAPEVWEHNSADAPVDIYALGCIVYEMLTGDVLFTGATPIQAMHAHARGPQFPATWPSDVPPGIADVLGKALARDPAARHPSAGALWQALNDREAQRVVERAAAVRTVASERIAVPHKAAAIGTEAAQAAVSPTAIKGTASSAAPVVPALRLGNLSGTTLLLIPLGISLDIAGGELVKFLQLPLWLDSIGTILVGALLGPWVGAITGLLGRVIWMLLGLNTDAVWFAPALSAAGVVAGFAGRLGLFQRVPPRWLSALIGGALAFALALFMFMFLHSSPNDGWWPTLPVAGELVAQYGPICWGALALGLLTGYFALRNVGYAGLAGLLTGVITAIVGAPSAAWLFDGEVAPIAGAALFGRGTVPDPLDKLIVFLIVYLIVRLLPTSLRTYFPNLCGAADSSGES